MDYPRVDPILRQLDALLDDDELYQDVREDVGRRRRLSLASCSNSTIVRTYRDEDRGFVRYSLLAITVFWLNRYRWIVQPFFTHTLAATYHRTTRRRAKRFQATVHTLHGSRICLEATLIRKDDKKPLVARFGGIPLVYNHDAVLGDRDLDVICSERKGVDEDASQFPVNGVLSQMNQARFIWDVHSPMWKQ